MELWGEKVAVGSGLGPKAGNWQQVLLSCAASSFTNSHPLAIPHTRQGVAITKGSMFAIHQMMTERGSPDREIRVPSIESGGRCVRISKWHRAEQLAMNEGTLCTMH